MLTVFNVRFMLKKKICHICKNNMITILSCVQVSLISYSSQQISALVFYSSLSKSTT